MDTDKDTRPPVELLERRRQLTEALAQSPYDLILFLERAAVHTNLSYPDLAAGDAYRALLLTDEARDESFEYHEQARETLEQYLCRRLPEVLRHGSLGDSLAQMVAEHAPSEPGAFHELLAFASIQALQMLSLSLLLCGCLKSAHSFCARGLRSLPRNQDLLKTKSYIEHITRQRMHLAEGAAMHPNDLPDRGLVRREVYPWNKHEPDRISDEALAFLNQELAVMAPACAVQVTKLPILAEDARNTDGYGTIPTRHQLGLFANQDMAAGEIVLREYSLLTANNRLKESTCDACGSELPALELESQAVNCPECCDTVFCNDYCFSLAQAQYHPAVCDKDVDCVAKNPAAKDADDSLYLLLLGRLLAMADHQDTHPLDLTAVKYIWGDFMPTQVNEVDLSANTGPPPEWTLPFSFTYNIKLPLHMLEKMDVDVFATLDRHDLWVFNTAYSKFRGTASARKNNRNGRPDLAAVHPFWCLANHDCNPNVTWEWDGCMKLWTRDRRVVGHLPGGIRAGEEILNHYCDVDLPVQQRREWARGSLGGQCMCRRCREESNMGGWRS